MMKIKLNTGLSVRTGPDGPDGRAPLRSIGEAGDVVDVDTVPEWEGKVPEWLVEQRLVEVVEDDRKKPGKK